MADNNQVVIELLLANNQYLAKLTESMQKTKDATSKMASGFTAIGVAMKTVMASTALKAFDYMLQKAEAAKDAQDKLNLRLQSTKGIAGVTADAINKYAKELNGMSVHGKTALVAVQTELLKFTNIHTNEFKGALQSTLDLSAGMEIDLTSASQIVGRALQNPANAARSLRAANIMLSSEQSKLINNMIKTGNVAGAQKIIMEEISKLYAGRALEAAQSYDGTIQRLKNTLNGFVADAGQSFLPGVTKIGNALIGLSESDKKVGVFSAAIQMCIAPLKAFVDYAAWALDGMSSLYKKVSEILSDPKLNTSALNSVANAMEKIVGKPKTIEGKYSIIQPKGGESDADKALREELKKRHEIVKIFGQLEAQTKGFTDSIYNYFQTVSSNAVQSLETMRTRAEMVIEYTQQKSLEAAGIQEESAAQRNAKELSTLQKQYSKTLNISKRQALREQILEKQKEQKKLEIQEKTAKQKQQLDLIMEFLEIQRKRREFERNKKYQLAMVWINTAAAITAAWLTAWSMGFPVAAIAMGIVSTALLLANAAAQTAVISTQQAPAFAQGSWDVQTTGPAILHGGEIVTPKPLADSIRSGDASLSAGGGGTTIHVHGNVYDKRGFAQVLKDTIQSNNLRFKFAGAN